MTPISRQQMLSICEVDGMDLLIFAIRSFPTPTLSQAPLASGTSMAMETITWVIKGLDFIGKIL